MERNQLNLLNILALLLLAWNLSVAAEQPHLQGMEISSDKVALAVGGKMVNLHGVHFPAESGLCGQSVEACRVKAMDALGQWVDDRQQVECRVLAIAASGTHFAECHFGDTEIGRWLVANGLALADRQVSRRYIREEQSARRAGVGIWEQFGTQVSMLR
jgi:endonuclease YncB( thermonuclease family)